jgi:hypothetical protein
MRLKQIAEMMNEIGKEMSKNTYRTERNFLNEVKGLKLKYCSLCNLDKDFKEFGKHKNRKYGLADFCKECRNKKMVNQNHNLKPGTREEMFIKQNYKCAICYEHNDKFQKGLAVDHNHKTGQIRGLLCGKCNKAIGLMQDNIDILNNAITYLERYNK